MTFFNPAPCTPVNDPGNFSPANIKGGGSSHPALTIIKRILIRRHWVMLFIA
jgi:hypothetical protein